jgi:tetratricopeptide (TPR) repeat protein
LLQFQHTGFLYALAALPVMVIFFILYVRWKKTTAKKIGDEKLVRQLAGNYSHKKFSWKFVLICLGFAFAAISLANPRKPAGATNVNRKGIDVMVALDVSRSMLAEDISPNRLERAKQFIGRLVDKLSNDRIGIVVFAGRAYLQMPLTTDHAAAKMYLSSASPDVVPTQGTVISDALKMCYNAFNTKEKKYKAVVLISDGEDHDEKALEITKAMTDEGVMINTVGIGSPEGSMIEDKATGEYKRDAEGRPVITRLNETELKNMAVAGNGIYQLFSNADEAAVKIEKQLSTMGSRSVTENSLVNYESFFQWFLAATLFLLLLEFFISEKRKIKTKKLVAVLKAAALLLLIPFFSQAQTDNKILQQGNEAYSKQQYAEAATTYKKALAKKPSAAKAQFNLGNALYKDGKADEAVVAYDEAIEKDKTATEKSASHYNKGVVLQNNKKLAECIEAYKNALRLNPADEDARLNLQKALRQQKQQQQKENDKKKNQQQQQNQQQQPKPQQSKISKKEAEEKLKALLQQEKKLQDKLRRVDAATPEKPEKDW